MKAPAAFPVAPAQSGVYAAPAATASLRGAARAAGIAWFELDLKDVRAKPELLALCQKVFGLPPAFGHNWDALADSLEDFSWQPAPGYVVLVRHGGAFARSSPEDFATALEILAAAATYWASRRKVFLVLLDDDTRGAREFESLPR
jgi:hypothetical protein